MATKNGAKVRNNVGNAALSAIDRRMLSCIAILSKGPVSTLKHGYYGHHVLLVWLQSLQPFAGSIPALRVEAGSRVLKLRFVNVHNINAGISRLIWVDMALPQTSSPTPELIPLPFTVPI